MFGNNYGGYQPGQNGYGYQPVNYGGGMPGQMMTRHMQNENPFNWVLGQGEAEAYPVSPNSTVILWDSKANIIYIKSADQTGMPSMRKLKWEDYTDTFPQMPSVNPDEFVTRKEFNELLNRLGGKQEGTNNEQ